MTWLLDRLFALGRKNEAAAELHDSDDDEEEDEDEEEEWDLSPS
jgi:hypothetical protein